MVVPPRDFQILVYCFSFFFEPNEFPFLPNNNPGLTRERILRSQRMVLRDISISDHFEGRSVPRNPVTGPTSRTKATATTGQRCPQPFPAVGPRRRHMAPGMGGKYKSLAHPLPQISCAPMTDSGAAAPSHNDQARAKASKVSN